MTGPHVSSRGLRIAVYAAETGTVLLAAGAFILSFTALRDLAERSGIDPGLGWLWPLIVDGIIIVSTVSVFALAGTRVVWYPWLLLIVGSGVSVAANAIHAVVAAAPDVADVLAAAVASVPPIVLVASTHLTAILIRHSRTVLTPTLPVPAHEVTAEEPEPHTHAPRADLEAPELAGNSTGLESELPPATAPVSDAPAEDARLLLAHRLRSEKLSNAQIARILGVHRSTVGRILGPKPPGISVNNDAAPETAEQPPAPAREHQIAAMGELPESNEKE